MSEIHFADPRGHADFATLVGRARTAHPQGAIRFQAQGRLLVLTVAVIEGSGLLGEGTVLGMRIMPVVEGPGLDVTVSLASVTDRLARAGADASAFPVPPTTVAPPWAGLTPPREGWELVGTLPGEEVTGIALRGIEAVAAGAGPTAGAHAVDALRRRVWGGSSDTRPPLVSGLAFAAHVLGFLRSGQPATLAAHGRWTRLSTVHGHALVR
ncbi:MAG TPA: hypothetical protein VFJ94_08730 [Intrasporangium sp.]|uniref:hypothetical protein n=1 Tax=Intrasporangium sp. TaxID=1925024 RepID=UPI002D77FF40|nr:hypothetical protein [Intrasporangium sp.]HET7398593.1 hypothetical protein [Intrasporangium sp.]